MFRAPGYLAGALLLIPCAATAWDNPTDPSPDSIVARMLETERRNETELREYTSERRYFMENKRFGKKAESRVRMSFRHPDVKEFAVLAESGSRFVHQRVFRRMMDSERRTTRAAERRVTAITPLNYHFEYRGAGEDRGRPAHMFDIVPKTRNEFLIRGRIWIDTADFAITRIEGQPSRNPSVWVRKTHFVHTYQKVGAFWLAEANTSETDVLVFGRTVVEIRYSDYHVNPGRD